MHEIDKFCADQGIQWSFVPKHGPHFGRLWEVAVKSLKHHFQRIVGNVCLTFEELATIQAQVEAWLNSRPLMPLPQPEDGIEILTPGHFLIRQSLEALPNLSETSKPISSLQHWHLCQVVTRHLWQCWSQEYLTNLQQFAKWSRLSTNIKVGDIVCVMVQVSQPTKWPLARIQ